MKTGVLGGTFNPVHNGHVYMAVEAIEVLGLDRLIVMPNYIPPHKKAEERDPGHILEMLRLAFLGIENIIISDYEILREDVSYTYLTMEHLKEEYPLDELFFIIGEDSFIEFSRWREPGRILAASRLAVFERRSYPHEMRKEALEFVRSLGHEPVILDSLILEISSSDARRRISEGRSIRFMVPLNVESYIIDNNLYGGKNVDRT